MLESVLMEFNHYLVI